MSMELCRSCDRFIDTDEDDTGEYESWSPWRFTCGACLDRNHMATKNAGQFDTLEEWWREKR